MRGIRRADLQACCLCGKGLLHDGNIVAYGVTVQQYIADVGAINRQAGLEMMLGGHASLAHIMGTDSEFLKAVGEEKPKLVCQPCFLHSHTASIWEAEARTPEEAAA